MLTVIKPLFGLFKLLRFVYLSLYFGQLYCLVHLCSLLLTVPVQLFV